MKFQLSLVLALLLSCFFVAPLQAASSSQSSTPVKVVKAQQVNINSASADLIAETLKGIGPAKAKAIVEWRKANGKFKSLEELVQVKGIGSATLEKNAKYIRLK